MFWYIVYKIALPNDSSIRQNIIVNKIGIQMINGAELYSIFAMVECLCMVGGMVDYLLMKFYVSSVH